LVRPGDEEAFLLPLDIDILPGIGPRSAELLRERGVRTIGDLRRCDDVWLRQVFGRRGPELRERAASIDHSPVTPQRETRSVSAETTMAEDVDDPGALREQMLRLAERVGDRLRKDGLLGKTVSIKLRLADFTTFTRQTTLKVPTNDAGEITRASLRLLERELAPGRRFRLLGAGVSNLADSFQLPLFPLE
jgi:nucleotidyltransferase/DNA polymerase involved in DNA repair